MKKRFLDILLGICDEQKLYEICNDSILFGKLVKHNRRFNISYRNFQSIMEFSISHKVTTVLHCQKVITIQGNFELPKFLQFTRDRLLSLKLSSFV